MSEHVTPKEYTLQGWFQLLEEPMRSKCIYGPPPRLFARELTASCFSMEDAIKKRRSIAFLGSQPYFDGILAYLRGVPAKYRPGDEGFQDAMNCCQVHPMPEIFPANINPIDGFTGNDGPYQEGNVIQFIGDHRLTVLGWELNPRWKLTLDEGPNEYLLEVVSRVPNLFRLYSSRIHENDDFSYVCGFEWCKCKN